MIALLLLAACTGGSDDETPLPEHEVISLETRDGVNLEADWYPAEAGSPGLLLLHMSPKSFDRTGWPGDFIEMLKDKGWAVLVPDRRGAGGSGGEAEDAYLGETSTYDTEAGMLYLEGQGMGPLAIIGASNGTTSTVDYCVWAPGEGLPSPVATGLMTGGGYTENQTPMEDFAALSLPTIFTYSTEERDWSVDQQALDPGSWEFDEYAEGDHGTKMFDAEPRVKDDLVDFFDMHL